MFKVGNIVYFNPAKYKQICGSTDGEFIAEGNPYKITRINSYATGNICYLKSLKSGHVVITTNCYLDSSQSYSSNFINLNCYL